MPSPSTVLLRTQTDDRLVALVRAGHDRAFEAIVERYRRPLLRACRRILPEARAEDALQQSLVAAWNGLRRGDDVHELRPWLYRIARNTALNQLRQGGYDLDELVETLSATHDPEEEVLRRAVVRQTLAAVAALPERQRDALLQTAVEGRGQDEVARDLGLTDTAVRALVHRARVRVRAAATVVVPLPMAAWVAEAGVRAAPMTERIAELAGGAGGAATLAKVGTVAVLAGGAVATPPRGADTARSQRERHAARFDARAVTPRAEKAAAAAAPVPVAVRVVAPRPAATPTPQVAETVQTPKAPVQRKRPVREEVAPVRRDDQPEQGDDHSGSGRDGGDEHDGGHGSPEKPVSTPVPVTEPDDDHSGHGEGDDEPDDSAAPHDDFSSHGGDGTSGGDEPPDD
jgi:RNA polymerase sigma factor (sigma-70 family)